MRFIEECVDDLLEPERGASIVDTLVDKGKLTEDEADAVEDALFRGGVREELIRQLKQLDRRGHDIYEETIEKGVIKTILNIADESDDRRRPSRRRPTRPSRSPRRRDRGESVTTQIRSTRRAEPRGTASRRGGRRQERADRGGRRDRHDREVRNQATMNEEFQHDYTKPEIIRENTISTEGVINGKLKQFSDDFVFGSHTLERPMLSADAALEFFSDIMPETEMPVISYIKYKQLVALDVSTAETRQFIERVNSKAASSGDSSSGRYRSVLEVLAESNGNKGFAIIGDYLLQRLNRMLVAFLSRSENPATVAVLSALTEIDDLFDFGSGESAPSSINYLKDDNSYARTIKDILNTVLGAFLEPSNVMSTDPSDHTTFGDAVYALDSEVGEGGLYGRDLVAFQALSYMKSVDELNTARSVQDDVIEKLQSVESVTPDMVTELIGMLTPPEYEANGDSVLSELYENIESKTVIVEPRAVVHTAVPVPSLIRTTQGDVRPWAESIVSDHVTFMLTKTEYWYTDVTMVMNVQGAHMQTRVGRAMDGSVTYIPII